MILGATLRGVTNSKSADVAILLGKRRPLRGDLVTQGGLGGGGGIMAPGGRGVRRSGRLIADIAIDSRR